MAITTLFSKRRNNEQGIVSDVYLYDEFPERLKVQIVHIIKDAIGRDSYSYSTVENLYQHMKDILCREYGLFELAKYCKSVQEEIFQYFLEQTEVDLALDFVEIVFINIDVYVRNKYPRSGVFDVKISADDAILELNHRFEEHCFGYRYESKKIIRIDSKVIHENAIKPALTLLTEEIYHGAEEEFLKAHEHYRHKRYKECLNESLKSLESVMKVICEKNGWKYNKKDTASSLIDICFRNELVPQFLQSQFTSLSSLLKSGIPTLRNNMGGHGQGVQLIEVTQALASFALNMTASNILLLVENEKLLWGRNS